MTDIAPAPLRIALGSSLPEPDESIARMITSGRSSLAFFLGDEACRYRLLAASINWDRILIAYRDCTPLGYAAFKHHWRGPFSPGAGPFLREFGRLRGAARYLLFALTEGREWYYGFYLYGLHVIKHARHQGIASALLSATFDQAGRAGYDRVELEVQVKNQRARRLYEHLGFIRVRTTPLNWLGRFLPFPSVINMRRTLKSLQ
ncbi:GNAT family N-acetyltransferase [Pseudomonas moorei]|uniref:Acetyltransferase (GNAT) family protein n=1 Tax=Pseudomonas moorei TaxID=395599 RepID=A0A1H1CCE5_9PSED|nr:GNAT family N-acetyltransferase [Pseudomonas moorei]KAB0504874.1 GNAT family N-acetyltransferase [Pseudomonas moorei]SDQ61907.1 Acetyltransferase (GNAT) family protein [Pseudomonas moorei]